MASRPRIEKSASRMLNESTLYMLYANLVGYLRGYMQCEYTLGLLSIHFQVKSRAQNGHRTLRNRPNKKVNVDCQQAAVICLSHCIVFDGSTCVFSPTILISDHFAVETPCVPLSSSVRRFGYKELFLTRLPQSIQLSNTKGSYPVEFIYISGILVTSSGCERGECLPPQQRPSTLRQDFPTLTASSSSCPSLQSSKEYLISKYDTSAQDADCRAPISASSYDKISVSSSAARKGFHRVRQLLWMCSHCAPTRMPKQGRRDKADAPNPNTGYIEHE
ncbi:uncharacterized protein [Asterias amurensis]|uniref:uncharacterized protein n=1 Tax=Asterias amurensis TaxID=7602 RepID=UPI003AB3A68A